MSLAVFAQAHAIRRPMETAGSRAANDITPETFACVAGRAGFPLTVVGAVYLVMIDGARFF